MIYVLQILDGKHIKIGYTSKQDISERISQLQTGNPFEITPVLLVAGSLLEEQAFHRAMRPALEHLHLPLAINEWYPGKHPFVQRVLIELRYGAPSATAYVESYFAERAEKRHARWVQGVNKAIERHKPDQHTERRSGSRFAQGPVGPRSDGEIAATSRRPDYQGVTSRPAGRRVGHQNRGVV